MTIESGSIRVADNLLGPINRWNFHLAHIDRSPGGGITPFSPFLSSFFISSEVEGDEQQEIRAENPHARKRSEFFSGTFAIARQLREVGRTEICIRSKVDEPCHSQSAMFQNVDGAFAC